MKPTNLAILNRGDVLPDDGWYQVVPTGEFIVKHNGQRIMQVIDSRAVSAMAQRFLDSGEQLLVDFDHFSYDTGQRSEAAGWIDAVEARENGLWAHIKWSDIGAPAILNKRYRFVSPVWMPDDCEDLGNNRVRPLRLDSVGLTNQPNLKGMQPLSNRGGGDGLSNSHRNKETDSMKKVLELLGLSADAAEDSAVEAVTALQNRAAQADAMKNRAESAEAKVQQAEAAQLEADAEAFCETHKDVIVNRDSVKAQFIANRAATETLFAGIKAKAPEADKGSSLKNRAVGQPDSLADTAKEQQKASAIRNRAHRIMTEQKVPFSVAFERAKSEQQD